MKITLGQEDRQAVDLLLDRGANAVDGSNGATSFAAADPVIGNRVVGAQRLLQLLELLPGIEPPDDLVARTLRHIAGASQRPDALQSRVPQFMDSHSQHA